MTFPYSIGMYDAVITNLQITLQDINISEQVQAPILVQNSDRLIQT